MKGKRAENEIPSTEFLSSREKRKWQLALRRYVLIQSPSSGYGPYFGIDHKGFREWISLQFSPDLNWQNFAEKWQFDHIVPISYFDFGNDEDLKLCWHYINIRIEKFTPDSNKSNRVDVLAAKAYFKDLYHLTAHPICAKMLEKIEVIEHNIYRQPILEKFIKDRKDDFDLLQRLSVQEFKEYNEGRSLEDIRLEKDILKKFG